MSFKDGATTYAVRELTFLRHAKKLARQMLSDLSALRLGFRLGNEELQLVYPEAENLDSDDMRSYLKRVSSISDS